MLLKELIPKSLTKHHFTEFTVLGQFNHGFILSFFPPHFYLIDQHAASEKNPLRTTPPFLPPQNAAQRSHPPRPYPTRLPPTAPVRTHRGRV